MKPSPLLAIFLIVFVDVLGFTIIIPLLPIYAESLGATPFIAGLLVSVYGLCQLIAGPLLGQWSDRVGRKPVLIISQVGTLVGFVILAESNALWLVFVSRIIDGLTAGNISVAQAHIADVVEPKNRAKGFGAIGVAFSIGFMVGPAIAGLLAHVSYRAPIYAAVGLSALSILATCLLLPSGKPAKENTAGAPSPGSRIPLRAMGAALADPKMGPLLWQFLAFTFAFSMLISGFPLFAIRRYAVDGRPFDVQHVGWVFALMGLIGIVIQGGLIGRLVDWAGEKALVIIGFALTAAGAGLLTASSGIPILLVGVILLAVGSSLIRPNLTSQVARTASPNERGMAIGMTQSMMSMAQILAPAVGGFIIGRGYLALWCAGIAAVCLPGLFLARSTRAD